MIHGESPRVPVLRRRNFGRSIDRVILRLRQTVTALALFALLSLPAIGAAPRPTIRWLAEAAPVVVEAVAIDAEQAKTFERAEPTDPRWAGLLAVFAEQAGGGGVPPMAGTWQWTDGRLRFTPRFPLARGVRYRAELRLPGAAPIVAYYELPADTSPLTSAVVQVYPTSSVLPENQLKFYVQFSSPMSRGEAYQHIQIRDANGRPIELALLELTEELWDPSMTRLTLLIDPGRIKRGVKPLEDNGPVLEAGKNFALTVAASFPDAASRPLRAAFAKNFRVGPADRSPPDPAHWKIRPAAAGTREALVVSFDEAMDYALALRLIKVVAALDPKSEIPLAGESSLGADEREWRFSPAQPWRRGAHRLVVATTIEDLAGNNIGKTFDVDLAEGGERPLETPSVSVAFAVP